MQKFSTWEMLLAQIHPEELPQWHAGFTVETRSSVVWPTVPKYLRLGIRRRTEPNTRVQFTCWYLGSTRICASKGRSFFWWSEGRVIHLRGTSKFLKWCLSLWRWVFSSDLRPFAAVTDPWNVQSVNCVKLVQTKSSGPGWSQRHWVLLSGLSMRELICR